MESSAPHEKSQPQAAIKPIQAIENCEHINELSVFCQAHDMALCNDCYFENHTSCGKGMTLKQAASQQIVQFENILNECGEALDSCSDMQNRLQKQEGLEEEVLKKVNKQYEQLKAIIDEQKIEAQNTIKHLESVQDYKPPPKDFSQDTLDKLKQFETEIKTKIQKQKQMSSQSKYLNVLKDRVGLTELQTRTIEFQNQLKSHSQFIQDNARPSIEVRGEVDKFRGFLHDVVSFEPDFILQTERPRLHYYDEDNKQMQIHELASQTTTTIGLRNAELLPQEFTSIQAQNKIFMIGGEKKENEIRTVVSNDCFLLNEQTYEVERRAPMKSGRAGHQLAHLHRKFEYQTKDYIYAVGSKYPDETSKKCEVYDVAKNKWTEIGDLNQSRHYHTICILENRFLYVIGGRDSLTEAPLESIERLDGFVDLEKQKWDALQIVNKDSLWSARDTMGSFSLSDSEILIFGGDYGWISDSFCLNTKSGEIERLDCSLKKPEEFFHSKAVRYNDKIFTIGCLDKDVHVFLPKAKKWFLLDKWFVDW